MPVPPREFYAAVLDVRGFPAWAPGVRRVEVLMDAGEVGMLSEWEVSFLGFKRRVLSVLEAAEDPSYLRWTYDGSVEGWGECFIRAAGDGTIATFRTALEPTEPLLAALSRSAPAKDAAGTHLKRSLRRLGQLVAGDGAKVTVGPVSHAEPVRTPPTTGAKPLS